MLTGERLAKLLEDLGAEVPAELQGGAGEPWVDYLFFESSYSHDIPRQPGIDLDPRTPFHAGGHRGVECDRHHRSL